VPEYSVRDRTYLFLLATFLTALLVADVTAGKFFMLGGMEVSVGVIPFPVTFILTDVVNEYYGRRGARMLTVIGAAMLVFAFIIITASRLLPVAARSPVPGPAFDAVFGVSYRFFGASLCAFLVGQLADIHAFHFVKRVTESRHLWLRATGSTAISQVIDTAVVNVAALAGTMSLGEIGKVAAFSYAYKMVAAITLTPVLYAAHGVFTRVLGLEPLPAREAEPQLAARPAEAG
jgi:uncharacterized integral membrane protein (TIGR00697 family)